MIPGRPPEASATTSLLFHVKVRSPNKLQQRRHYVHIPRTIIEAVGRFFINPIS